MAVTDCQYGNLYMWLVKDKSAVLSTQIVYSFNIFYLCTQSVVKTRWDLEPLWIFSPTKRLASWVNGQERLSKDQ